MDRWMYVDVWNNRPRSATSPSLPGPYVYHPSMHSMVWKRSPTAALQSWSSAPGPEPEGLSGVKVQAQKV